MRDEIESLLVQSGYLENAPFTWVTLVIRYGLINDQKPYYQKINLQFGDLPIAIEVDVREMVGSSFDSLVQLHRRAALIALIHAGQKFDLPVAALEGALNAAQSNSP